MWFKIRTGNSRVEYKSRRIRYDQCLNCHMSENTGHWTMAEKLDTITDDYSSEKRQHATLSELQNFGTISLVSHQSKVMVRVILNKLVNQVEQILEEEQSEQEGFRLQRSRVKLNRLSGKAL